MLLLLLLLLLMTELETGVVGGGGGEIQVVKLGQEGPERWGGEFSCCLSHWHPIGTQRRSKSFPRITEGRAGKRKGLWEARALGFLRGGC